MLCLSALLVAVARDGQEAPLAGHSVQCPVLCSGAAPRNRESSEKARRKLGESSEKVRRKFGESSEKVRRKFGESSEKVGFRVRRRV